MKQHSGFLPLVPLLVACLGVPCTAVRAEAELFPATEVTARYTPADLVRAMSGGLLKLPKLAAAEPDFNAIEPAAGHGGEAKTEDKAEGEGGGHGAPKATGKSEGAKSFTGKEIGVPPPLPKVVIGGAEVITKATSLAHDMESATPESLKSASFAELLDRRYNVTPYAHSPQRGDPKAPVKILEFVDLSCGQCMPELAKIDTVLQAYASTTVVTHVHTPMMKFQDTNLPAFYGKVAARGGVFWQYREHLINDRPTDDAAMFDELVKSGMEVKDIRMLMLNEARRFYREMDADALLGRAFGVGQPPVLFVNGIRVGQHGIPLEKLPDVLHYVNARLERGLPEPPK